MVKNLQDFVYKSNIKHSCEWVILRIMFVFSGPNGRVRYERIVDNFRRYYQRRLDAGLPADKEDSNITHLEAFNPHAIDNYLKNGPLKNLVEKGFIYFTIEENTEFLYFKQEIWNELTPGDRAMLLAAIEDKLEQYFTNEVPHPEGTLAVPCVFCQREQLNIVKENELAFSVFDIFPAVPGHCLIIPKRHVRDVFGLHEQEIGAMLALLQEMKVILENEYKPDGFNIGFNVGYAAGQTVMHAHMHCFPRRWGDVENPRGGLRNIIPNWFKYPKE